MVIARDVGSPHLGHAGGAVKKRAFDILQPTLIGRINLNVRQGKKSDNFKYYEDLTDG